MTHQYINRIKYAVIKSYLFVASILFVIICKIFSYICLKRQTFYYCQHHKVKNQYKINNLTILSDLSPSQVAPTKHVNYKLHAVIFFKTRPTIL